MPDTGEGISSESAIAEHGINAGLIILLIFFRKLKAHRCFNPEKEDPMRLHQILKTISLNKEVKLEGGIIIFT